VVTEGHMNGTVKSIRVSCTLFLRRHDDRVLKFTIRVQVIRQFQFAGPVLSLFTSPVGAGPNELSKRIHGGTGKRTTFTSAPTVSRTEQKRLWVFGLHRGVVQQSKRERPGSLQNEREVACNRPPNRDRIRSVSLVLPSNLAPRVHPG